MPQVVKPNGICLGSRVFIFAGSSDPNTRTGDDTATAAVGSVYLRTDGGAGTSLYVREPSGWVAK